MLRPLRWDAVGGGGGGMTSSSRQSPEHDRVPMEMAVPNVTAATTIDALHRDVTQNSGFRVGMALPFTVGIFGNLLALFILHRTRSSSNQKHGFMLRCLITNDCIALTGMLIQMLVKWYWPDTAKTRWLCCARVLWRFFGLGSGCVAVVMAVERWLALTKPFYYQKVGAPPTPAEFICLSSITYGTKWPVFGDAEECPCSLSNFLFLGRV